MKPQGMPLKTVWLVLAIVAGLCMAPAALAETCATACHGKLPKGAVRHAPFARGECGSCHERSGAKHPGPEKGWKLAAAGGKLCRQCHTDLSGKKHGHAPVVGDDCLACHDPHASGQRGLLKAAVPELCYQCHDSYDAQKHRHGPVRGGICLTCHDVHQSDNARLLKLPQPELCYLCHGDFRRAMQVATYLHAPFATGGCTDCHTPHAGAYDKLLKGAYPAGFYVPYQEEQFSLCFSCHNPEAMRFPRTDASTGFRNGEQNLHFLHVNRDDNKGRSCRVCHDPHATAQPLLVVRRVRHFGSWNIPLRFTRRPNGGTCVVGCHKPKSYDRLNPVRNP